MCEKWVKLGASNFPSINKMIQRQKEKKRSIIIDSININILPFDNMFDRIISYLVNFHFFCKMFFYRLTNKKISKIKLIFLLKKNVFFFSS